jgi:Flp pilus assembly protein TadD
VNREDQIKALSGGRPFKAELFCLLIVVFVGILYFNSLGNQFTNWDDGMIYNNPSIRNLDWNGIRKLFTLQKGSTYQPIRMLSYAIDYRLWKLNPIGYHITNILFYALTCLMVFVTIEGVSAGLRDKSLPYSHFRVAAFGTLIFAAHPAHVEAVTWLAARKEVLQGFFFFLGFYLYLIGREKEGWRKTICLVSVLLVILLAILSKPSAIVFPGVILLYEIAVLKERFSIFLRRHWAFLTIAVCISVFFTFIMMRVMIDAGGIKAYRGWNFGSNLLVPIYAFWESIRLLTLTVNYSAAYAIVGNPHIFSIKNVILLILTFAFFGLSFYSLRKTKVIFLGFFFFVVTLLPYLNIIPISTLVADRYVFIASFSFAFLLGIGFERLYTYRHRRMSEGFFKVLAMSLFVFLLLGYSFMTVRQNTIWENSYTLWADAVEKSPNSNAANALMGVVYMELGMDEDAVRYLEKAIDLLPYDFQSRNNLGIVYGRTNEFEKGINELETAMTLNPNDDAIKINLAILYERMNNYAKSEEILNYVISRDPKNGNLYFRKGLLLRKEGRIEEAISEYKKSIELAPQIINPYEEIGNIYLSHFEDSEKAKYYYSKGIEAVPKAKYKVEELRQVIQDLEGRQ